MTAISAAAMRCNTMADGSLRITVEVEPADAQRAFAMFGRPGAPMALVALEVGHAQVQEPEKPKGGERCRWVAIRGKEPEFIDFLKTHLARYWAGTYGVTDEARAADAIREYCGVASRAEIDTSTVASQRLDDLRHDWIKHQRRNHE